MGVARYGVRREAARCGPTAVDAEAYGDRRRPGPESDDYVGLNDFTERELRLL